MGLITLAEATVPLLPTERGRPIASIGVYVDDFLFSGPRDVLTAFHAALKGHFDIGVPDVLGEGKRDALTFLGVTMEVDPQDPEALCLHQASYAFSILERFKDDLASSKKSTTVPAPHETFGMDNPSAREPSNKKETELLKRSQQILGAILWLVTRTRPDLNYAHSMGG